MHYIRYFFHIVSFYRNFVSRYSKGLSRYTFEETLRRNVTIASRIHSRSFRLRKLPKHQVCKWKLARNEIRSNWKKRIAPFSVFLPAVSLLLPRLFAPRISLCCKTIFHANQCKSGPTWKWRYNRCHGNMQFAGKHRKEKSAM